MATQQGYLHGYSQTEQDRLVAQARFLADMVLENVRFEPKSHILEIGCGVGAQSKLLLERYPGITLHGVDISQVQVQKATESLAAEIHNGLATFSVADASNLSFEANSFDGAYVCWLLEHVANPLSLLREARRVLKPGAPIFVTEVMNWTLFLYPRAKATMKFWEAFNAEQIALQGDPHVGARLGNLLLEAGFETVHSQPLVAHFDAREPAKRAAFLAYWSALLHSGAPALLEGGKVTVADLEAMTQELEALKNAPDAIFHYSPMQAWAKAI